VHAGPADVAQQIVPPPQHCPFPQQSVPSAQHVGLFPTRAHPCSPAAHCWQVLVLVLVQAHPAGQQALPHARSAVQHCPATHVPEQQLPLQHCWNPEQQ
jgi:hypothetical protein